MCWKAFVWFEWNQTISFNEKQAITCANGVPFFDPIVLSSEILVAE